MACGPKSDSARTPDSWDRGPNPHAQDDLLRLNHVQTKGTHNSYHQEPANPVDPSHRYSQPTLTSQLDEHHVRQLELDVHLREDGTWAVFHIPALDQETSCEDFSACLQELRDWSDDHGWHLPIVVWLEPKDDIDAAVQGLQSIEGHIHELDDAVRAVWPEDRLFTPDDLRGDHADLPTALAADGWPLLGEVRGQAIFALLDSSEHRDAYVAGNEALEGRALFVDTSTQSDPFAAMVKDGSPAQITEWVEAGFLITDNGSSADESADEARSSDQAILDAGVHHAATDLPAPGGEYWLDRPPRCNPVAAPSECDDTEIEKL